MSTHDFDYDLYESLYDPARSDRKARRSRKPKVKHTPKKSQNQIVAELADPIGLEGGFRTTYQPSRHEEGWLLDSLKAFYQQHYISDVLAVVKGGKEASVYRCQALPHTGETLLAAKVYRPHQFRQIRNDAVYREGRGLLSSGGVDLNQTVHGDRIRRAVGKKTAFGRQVSHTSWLMHEFKTLDDLHRAGAAVPRPIAASDNAILMTYCGDASTAAPLLSEVDLDADEVAPLFDEVIRNVELMLQHGLIHGDLSAYNILYWGGQITLIDFPQVVDAHANSQARFILRRDLERVCEYFADQGLERDPEAIQRRLWKQYLAPNPREEAADLSRLLESEG